MIRSLVGVSLVLSLVVGLAAKPGWAADAPLPVDDVAARVKAAHLAGDAAKLAEWSAKDAPDPWLVADALLVTGAREAAEAFAKAAPRKDVERLPEFVAGWKTTDGDAAARQALANGNAALGAQRYTDALAAFDSSNGEATVVVGIRLNHGRAIALHRLDRVAEAATRYAEVATSSEGIGWLARATSALWDLARAEFAAKRPEQAVAAAGRLVDVEGRRGNRTRVADANRFVGGIEAARGGNDAAVAALGQAIAIYDEVADRAGAARVRNDLADVLIKKRDFKGAEREALAALAVVEPAALWPEVVRSQLVIANVHRVRNKGMLAIGSLESAATAGEKSGDPRLIASTSFELGKSLSERGEAGDLERALELQSRVEKIYEGLKDRPAAAIALVNVAKANVALGRADVARPQADRIVALGRELRDPWIEARGLVLQGEVAELQKTPDLALAAYTAASASFEAAGNRVEAARTEVAAADVMRRMGDLVKARERADRAQKAGDAVRDRGVISYAMLVGARIRKDQGQTKEALLFARQALDLYRALNNSRGAAELAALIKELEAAPR